MKTGWLFMGRSTHPVDAFVPVFGTDSDEVLVAVKELGAHAGAVLGENVRTVVITMESPPAWTFFPALVEAREKGGPGVRAFLDASSSEHCGGG
jgi:hypothetical protein